MQTYRRCKRCFREAVHILAVGEGDVRSRLRIAYGILHRLTARDVPPDLQAEWQSILCELASRGPEQWPDGEQLRNALDHTLGRMRNSTGRKTAEKIWVLADHLKELRL